MLRHVDLCSGIGGFALGFEWAGLSRPVMFCDIEPWSRKILAKHWPDVPIQEDVKVLANDARRLVPDCDILTAGYPCQPFSAAGKRRGEEDPRHIFPHILAIVAQKRPAWCVFENVYGHLTLGLDNVLHAMEGEGYACRTYIVSASGAGARHERKRLWVVGHTEDNGWQRRGEAAGRKGQTHQLQQQPSFRGEPNGPSEDVADTNGEGLQGHTNANRQRLGQSRRQQITDQSFSRRKENVADTNSVSRRADKEPGQSEGSEWRQPSSNSSGNVANARHQQPTQDCWATEPRMGDLADGIPSRLDGFDGWEREPVDIPRVATGIKDRASRLKGLGNAIVPQIAMQIGIAIRQCEAGTTCQ